MSQSSTPQLVRIDDFSPVTVRNIDGCKEFLRSNNWPPFLQNYMISHLDRYPIRYFIIDDSSSMGISDGERFINDDTNFRNQYCTRWEELAQTLKFQIALSTRGDIKSKFFMLSGQEFDNETSSESKMLMKASTFARGGTPLCQTIYKVIDDLKSHEDWLRENDKVATVSIATDGLSSDGDVAIPLNILKNMPVRIILRLCTDEDSVVEYWNKIDKELEINLDILDGYVDEAIEIYKPNPWLCYGLPLHQMREFGVSSLELDHINDRELDYVSKLKLVTMIYGDDFSDVITDVDLRNASVPKQFCPIKWSSREWISLTKNSCGCVIA